MRGLRLLLAALTPLCNAAVYLSPNRLTAPPSIEQNIAETKRVIQREESFTPLIVHQRGSVRFPSDGSFTAVRPDFPGGLALVGGETEDEEGIMQLVGAEEVALLLGRALQFYDIPSQANDVDLRHFHPSQPFRGGGTYYWTETTAPLTYIAQRLLLGVMAVIGGGT
ncbi:hypothetical protein T484DRAFT_2027242 [Baffinella frigidus]|nr:hypothetical protein T484DRAFT_2027242 [Cryptophyta sp. CCMP2293]